MNTRTQEKAQTRQKILDAASRLSAERGFSSLSLRAVAQEAGIGPSSFYRHFTDLDDLGLALVDQVGMNLRLLVRRARQSILEDGGRNVVRAPIRIFMDLAATNRNLFRLLLGEGSGSTPAFREAIAKEIQRFTSDLVEDLKRGAAFTGRPLAHVECAAEAMVTVAFNLGAAAVDRSAAEREETTERIIREVRIIMRGAEAMAAGWEPAHA